MYSRISTLLNKFDLNERRYENVAINNGLLEIDFNYSRSIIEQEREKSYEFLKKALTR